MSLIISHNTSALNTHRNLSLSGDSMSKAIEKLSSGYKINVGADDPSGLIISEQLRSQISGLERAVRNSSEAYNLIGIAEGALNEMNTILKKMRALAIHACNSGVTSPEQVAADQSEMDSGIETLNRIANTTRYSDQYLLNGSKELVYDINTVVNEPTDHALLDTKLTRVDQVFKRDGVKVSIGYTGEKSQYQANTKTSAQRAYLEADAAYSLSDITGNTVNKKQEFILTGTSGSRLFSFAAGTHVGTIVDAINNVRDSTGIGATLTFASDVRIDQSTNGAKTPPDYGPPPVAAEGYDGYADGTYVYQKGDVQIYGPDMNDPEKCKIESVTLTPDASNAFKVGFNCDGDGKIYAKVVDKSTNAIEYYKDKECTMLIGKGDDKFFAAANNSGIPSSPTQNLDGLFIKLDSNNVENLDVFEIGVVGQRLDNMKDMQVDGIQGWADLENSIMSGVSLGYNTSPEGDLYFRYTPVQFEADGVTVKTFKIEAFSDSSKEPKYLVASSGEVPNNMNAPQDATSVGEDPQLGGQTVRLGSVIMDNGLESGLNITLNLPKPGMIASAFDEAIEAMTAADKAAYDAAEALLPNGQTPKELLDGAVDAVKATQNYTDLTDSVEAPTKAVVTDIVTRVNTILAGNPADWDAVVTAMNAGAPSPIDNVKASNEYQTLVAAGKQTEAEQLILDTLAAIKTEVWQDPGVSGKSANSATVTTGLASNAQYQSAKAKNVTGNAKDMVEALGAAVNTVIGGTPATWEDVLTGLNLDAFKAGNADYQELIAAGKTADANKIVDQALAVIKGLAGGPPPAAVTLTDISTALNTGGASQSAEYTGVEGQTLPVDVDGLVTELTNAVNKYVGAKATPTSWAEVVAAMSDPATGFAANSDLYQALLNNSPVTPAELTGIYNAALDEIKKAVWTDGAFSSTATTNGAFPGDIQDDLNSSTKGSTTYRALLATGNSTKTQLDKVMEDALKAYDAIKADPTSTQTWQDAVREAITGSALYQNETNANKAALDAIANDLVVQIGNVDANYNTAVEATERMEEILAPYLKSSAATYMPKGEQEGYISFTNLGMRVYSMDYGSAETIRIQNKAGDLFYQYREADSMEKVMVKSGTTVQVAGQDAQISLNGAPVYTTGLIANTTTPDFSGLLVFNQGSLGATTLAVAGYDEGRLFSKATALQGVEENEAQIAEYNRHFEPPAVTVKMGEAGVSGVGGKGLLDKTGQPVNIYVDFSQLDPTVEVKVDNLDTPTPINLTYDAVLNVLRVDASGFAKENDDMIIDIPVNPEALKNGFYVDHPALKGMYIKSDVQIDVNKTPKTGVFETNPAPEIQANTGNVMLEVSTYATNPRANTGESMSNFKGGMQFQLGNTEGDQDRTIYSIQSMSMSNLGRISYNGQEYCLQNVLGGGEASLSKDPILAMKILAQAVDDVSGLRARLGAFQSNMLQTNINSLEVAIENITKTESAIRDTDMAAESTQFTRFQIMQQAGTSMLAQANQVSQNVLSLLQ